VPNLVGLTVLDAKAAWKAAGFTKPLSAPGGSNGQTVVSQQPATAGSCVPANTTESVTVG
jgi:beta-lactam-binding protein with PASTA domain